MITIEVEERMLRRLGDRLVDEVVPSVRGTEMRSTAVHAVTIQLRERLLAKRALLKEAGRSGAVRDSGSDVVQATVAEVRDELVAALPLIRYLESGRT